MANDKLKIPFEDAPKNLLIEIIKENLPFKDTPKKLTEKSKAQLLQLLRRLPNRKITAE